MTINMANLVLYIESWSNTQDWTTRRSRGRGSGTSGPSYQIYFWMENIFFARKQIFKKTWRSAFSPRCAAWAWRSGPRRAWRGRAAAAAGGAAARPGAAQPKTVHCSVKVWRMQDIRTAAGKCLIIAGTAAEIQYDGPLHRILSWWESGGSNYQLFIPSVQFNIPHQPR